MSRWPGGDNQRWERVAGDQQPGPGHHGQGGAGRGHRQVRPCATHILILINYCSPVLQTICQKSAEMRGNYLKSFERFFRIFGHFFTASCITDYSLLAGEVIYGNFSTFKCIFHWWEFSLFSTKFLVEVKVWFEHWNFIRIIKFFLCKDTKLGIYVKRESWNKKWWR